MKIVAILGATSHIAKGIIYEMSKQKKNKLILFARNIDNLKKFLKSNNINETENIFLLEEFGKENVDIIINCIGVGTPAGYKKMKEDIICVNEKYDNMIIKYLEKNKSTIYIYLSSGAIYGKEHAKPIDKDIKLNVDVNNIAESDFYFISKLYTETKHRAMKELNIVDIRIFSYISKFIDLDSKYLLTEMIKCVIEKRPFFTNRNNISRDYVSQEELTCLIEKIIKRESVNDWIDIYSKQQVTKFQLIEYFQKKYGLEVIYENNVDILTVTGNKNEYYTLNKKAEELFGYVPNKTSLDIIEEILKELI